MRCIFRLSPPSSKREGNWWLPDLKEMSLDLLGSERISSHTESVARHLVGGANSRARLAFARLVTEVRVAYDEVMARQADLGEVVVNDEGDRSGKYFRAGFPRSDDLCFNLEPFIALEGPVVHQGNLVGIDLFYSIREYLYSFWHRRILDGSVARYGRLLNIAEQALRESE